MKEITKKYLEESGMFNSTLGVVNEIVDLFAKEVDEDPSQVKEALKEEMGWIVEKYGAALDKMVPEEILEKAVEWYTSSAHQKLNSYTPILTGYMKSLNEEFTNRLRIKLQEIAGKSKWVVGQNPGPRGLK